MSVWSIFIAWLSSAAVHRAVEQLKVQITADILSALQPIVIQLKSEITAELQKEWISRQAGLPSSSSLPVEPCPVPSLDSSTSSSNSPDTSASTVDHAVRPILIH